jgi:hypothetical protein
VEQSIRQNREKAQFQMRCEETTARNKGRKKLLTWATVLAVLLGGFFITQLVNKGYQDALFVIGFLHLCCTIPFGWIALKALQFVPKTSESKSVWLSLSYVICIIGVFVAALLIWGFYPEPDQKNRYAALSGCAWAVTMIVFYSTILVTLLTRKKVS